MSCKDDSDCAKSVIRKESKKRMVLSHAVNAERGLPINTSRMSTQKGEVLFKQKHNFGRKERCE